MRNQVNVDSLASRLAFVIIFWLVLLLLVIFTVKATSVSASTTIQNNTFCQSITEKTKHTFSLKVFCDYARNSSNITVLAEPFFSFSSSGGSSGGFYCKEGYLFNSSTGECYPIMTIDIPPYKKPITQYDIYDAIIASGLIIATILSITLAFKLTKEFQGKK